VNSDTDLMVRNYIVLGGSIMIKKSLGYIALMMLFVVGKQSFAMYPAIFKSIRDVSAGLYIGIVEK
jgi:hypothetical protein